MLTTSIIVPPEVSFAPSTVSICSKAPASPTIITQTPMARIKVSWQRTVSSFPPKIPMIPPATMANTFIIVPNPIMLCSSFSFQNALP